MKFVSSVLCAVAVLCSSVFAGDTVNLDTGSLDDATYTYFTITSSPAATNWSPYYLQILDDTGFPTYGVNLKVERLNGGTWENMGGYDYQMEAVYFLRPTGSSTSYRIKHDSSTGMLPNNLEIWSTSMGVNFYRSYPAGDSNLDQHFNSTDLTAVAAAGKYETNQAATWAQGDWNRDGYFDSSDFVYVMQLGSYEGTDLEEDWEAAN